MSTEFPTHPTDVPGGATFTALANAYSTHAGRLVDAQLGLGEPLPAGRLVAHAVAALVVQHVLAERVLYSRWANVRDALVYGAALDGVAAACGLDPDEIVFGLRSWADGQLREDLITADQHAEIVMLTPGWSL